MGYRTYVMHTLTRVGLEKIVVFYWKLIGRPTDYLKGSRADRFRTIYREKRWSGGREDRPSQSGNGSTLPATENLRNWLPAYLRKIETKTLLDIGCGDYYWMKTVDLPCHYIGGDIVEDVIADDQKTYGDETHNFIVLDASTDSLPEADTILCREMLFHLSFADGLAALKNIRRSSARYLMATTDPTIQFNADVPTGAFRDVNLSIAPYNLGEPIEAERDGDGSNPRRVIAVWKLA